MCKTHVKQQENVFITSRSVDAMCNFYFSLQFVNCSKHLLGPPFIRDI